MARIGFIGAGLMGEGMARSLINAGHSVQVFRHRNGEPIERLRQDGASITDRLADVGTTSEVVILVLPGSPQVEEVLVGSGGLAHSLKPGNTVIDCSTSYPESTVRLTEQLREKQIGLLDAPLTGSPANADDGTLTIMVGGESEDFQARRPLFDAMGSHVFHVGKHGAGHTVKLLNNYLALIGVAATAEVLHFAAKMGVEPKSVWDVVRSSGGNSRAFETVGPRILTGEYPLTFELQKAYKDLTYVAQLAQKNTVPLGIIHSVMQEFEMAQLLGFAEDDYSSVGKMWENLLGVAPRAIV